MTISHIKNIHEFLAEAAIPNGFIKINGSWYYTGIEAILIISPQKSQYGNQYYINLGVYFRSLGEKNTPKVSECHINGRVDAILQGYDAKNFEAALDFENSAVDYLQRKGVIVQTLRDVAIPFLVRCMTPDGVRAAKANGELRQLGVMKLVSDSFQLQNF